MGASLYAGVQIVQQVVGAGLDAEIQDVLARVVGGLQYPGDLAEVCASAGAQLVAELAGSEAAPGPHPEQVGLPRRQVVDGARVGRLANLQLGKLLLLLVVDLQRVCARLQTGECGSNWGRVNQVRVPFGEALSGGSVVGRVLNLILEIGSAAVEAGQPL